MRSDFIPYHANMQTLGKLYQITKHRKLCNAVLSNSIAIAYYSNKL